MTQVLESLTDESLDQKIVPDHNSLGWLGWHIVAVTDFFAGQAGLKLESVGDPKNVPTKASEILEGFKKISTDLKKQVTDSFTDDSLEEEIEALGQKMPRGVLRNQMVLHHTHHRGQMTVLLRQAGLKVPSVMGPTNEDSGN